MTTVPMLRRPGNTRAPVPTGVHPLVRQFFILLEASGAAITDVYARSGVRNDTIRKWRKNANPSVHNFDAALNVLGYELKIVRRPDHVV